MIKDTQANGAIATAMHGWRVWAAFLIVLYLLAAGFGLRRSLIGTEVWAIHFATQPIAEHFEEIRRDLVHPPLIYLIERFWLVLFGDSDTAVKLLPLPINVATLILFTWIARRVVRHWRLASFLFAAAYLHPTGVASLVRMYGLLIFFSVLAIALWEAWRKRPMTSRLVAWAVAMVLMIYTHYSGLLALAAFVTANWLVGPRRRSFTLAGLAVGATFVPWALFVLPVLESRGLDTNLWWVHMLIPQPYKGFALLLYERLGWITDSRPWMYFLVPAAAAVHLAVLIPAMGSLRRLWPPSRTDNPLQRWLWVTALLAGVPVLLLLLFSITLTSAFAPRFVACILPAYWLLMALLAELGGRGGRIALFGLVLPWTLFSAGLSLYRGTRPGPLYTRTAMVAAQADPSDLVLCYDCNQVYWELHRRHRAALTIRALPLETPGQGVDLTALPRQPVQTIDLRTPDRIWYFHGGNRIPQANLEALEHAGFRVSKTYAGRAQLTVLSRPKHSQALDH